MWLSITHIDTTVLTLDQMAAAAVPMLAVAILVDGLPNPLSWSRRALFALMYLSLGGSVLAFWLNDIADHYARLLEKSGWKRSSRAAGDGVVVIRLSSTSTTKEEIVALVTVVALADPSQQEVSLRLMRIDPNRRFPQVPAGGRIGGSLTVGPGCC